MSTQLLTPYQVYCTFMHYVEVAHDELEGLIDEQQEQCEGTYEGATEAILLQNDIERTRKDISWLEKQMSEMEPCMFLKHPKPLVIPQEWTPQYGDRVTV